MSRLRLGDLPDGVGLDRMHEIGELDAILDEEDGDVVPDDIVVALGRVEPGSREHETRIFRNKPSISRWFAITSFNSSPDGEASDITDRIGAPPGSLDSAEPHEDGSLLSGIREELGLGEFGDGGV